MNSIKLVISLTVFTLANPTAKATTLAEETTVPTASKALQGPQGPQGSAGPAGVPGPTGPAGIDGMNGGPLNGRIAATGLASSCQDAPPAGIHSVTLCSGYWRGGVSGGGIGYDYVTRNAQWRIGFSAGHSSGEGVIVGRISRRF